MKQLSEHNHFGIDATIVADSENPLGIRLTTFVVSFPRIVLAEFNTHRVFSRNSASSRAVPFEKMVEQIRINPFIPIKWMKNHKGMQGNDYFTSDDMIQVNGEELSAPDFFREQWLDARDKAISSAFYMGENNLTKQFVNRLLEPFKWHTCIVTATEWENFFNLRAHEAAEIHIQDLAYKMLDQYNQSTPVKKEIGELHIPFGDNIKKEKIIQDLNPDKKLLNNEQWFEEVKMKVAIARCARVSYENYEGGDDYAKDASLYNKLKSMGHWSPFEHVASAQLSSSFIGNFKGWKQHRKEFSNENAKDERVKK